MRRLVQTLLIRDAWLKKNDHVEDGRAIAALEPLTVPLDQLRPTDLRQMIKEMDLGISINPDDDQNQERLLRILGLHPSHKERLSDIFKGGIPHQVLNARKHTEESQIIAGAGAFGAVTIATNMAGRGVDIKLGGELAEQILISVNRVLRRAGFENAYEMTLAQRREALLSLSPDDYGIYGSEIEFFLKSIREMESCPSAGRLACHRIGAPRSPPYR